MILAQLKKGDQYDGLVRIEKVAHPGPYIYLVSDGTGSMDAVTHSFEAQEGDVVRIKGVVEERMGQHQIRISTLKKEEVPFDEIVKSNTRSAKRSLSIDVALLREGESTISEIANTLRRTLSEGTAVLIRTHGDADGITGWVSLHRALSAQASTSRIFTNISKVPFYQYDDAMRDLSLLTRFRNAVLVLIDNGSTQDDTAACRLVSSAGIPVIVIDHHAPVDGDSRGRTLHLSPHLFGGDENIPAGALAYEVARQIDPSMDTPLIPGIACAGDKCEGEVADAYITKSGMTRDTLLKYGRAIDFLAYHLRFDSPLHLYERLLQDSHFCHEVIDHAETQVREALQRQHLRKEHIGEALFCQFDVDAEGFPPAGKIVGSVFESLKGEAEDVTVVGIVDDLLILRSSRPLLPRWIEEMREKEPVSGGGHPRAGTMRAGSTSAALDVLRGILGQE